MKRSEKLDILYEDKHMLIVNKPHNLLTIGTDKVRDYTLYRKVSDYVKKQHKSNKIFIVHRLDKDTSGIVIFAKDINVKNIMQNNWEKVKREYVALVEGKVLESGVVKSYLKETKTLYTYSTNDSKNGKLAITKYKVINSSKEYSLLNIEILTGRKNQIRVHMKDINHPIVGDKKYDSKKNPIRRMCLHAYYIKFIHPILNKEIEIYSDYPKIFEKLINKV